MFLPAQLKFFVVETIFVVVYLLLPPGVLNLGERCDFVCFVIMQCTKDFCVIPADFASFMHSSAFPCVLKLCPDENNHEGSYGKSLS